MAKARFRKHRPFNERSKKSNFKKPKKRFYIICEGKKTENQYFNGVFNHRVELGIDQLIDIIIIQQLDHHIPHPMYLAEACKYTIDNIENPDFFDNNELNFKAYDSKIDEIWLIFDRDPETLFKHQYDKVKAICEVYDLNIGMTNPNFEFWLLLHLPGIQDYNREELFQNKKDRSTGKRYLERELNYRLPGGYNKGNIKFERFKDTVDLALEQSGAFETKECNILTNLGTTVQNLILKMKED